jgi:hypothetical protein
MNTKDTDTKDDAMRFVAMKAVYSYVYPEVRPLIKQMSDLPIELFLTSTPVSQAQDIIDRLGFKKRFIVPSTIEGKVSLDEIHEPIIDRLVQEYGFFDGHTSRAIYGLKNFSYRYPTSGSSQGIFHLLADAKQKGIDNIYVLSGEYEGYREYGNTLGMKTIEFESLADAKNSADYPNPKKGLWFISNPSARNGNIIPNSEILDLCNDGHKVILDLAYVGMTKDYTFDVNHENIVGAVMSLSKPYGLFRFRTGFTFTREPITSLYANKWFKDVGRLLLGLKVVEEIGMHQLHKTYAGKQSEIISGLNCKFGLDIKQSDVLLLGYIPESATKDYAGDKLSMISPYKRSDNYRFCLTPYFEELEHDHGLNHEHNREASK